MQRRQFIKASLVTGGTVIGFSSVTYLFIDEVKKGDLTIESAFKRLDALSELTLVQTGKWDLYTIFVHCAQSIEFSITQFPEHKSSLFKSTVGSLALSLFLSKGKMTHNLSEPIPGAPLIHSSADIEKALARLKQAFLDFNHYKGKLAPHFAYGDLTKSEYEIAHVMHLYNHLEEIHT